MNIKYIISGVVFLVLGLLLLVWLIRKPIRFHEDPKKNIGADDLALHENLNKTWNQQGILASILGIILGLILIYEGITGVSPF